MIIDLQRRLAEIGRIRIGQQVATANGRTRPAKLDTFRLTSADPTRINHAARLYGGTPKQWDAPGGRQWEVVTTAAALDVLVPPSDMAFSQHYELWSAGGCLRRCDGRSETISDGPCLCDPERRECDIHTRLSVMLADLPGLGVWRIDTSGYYAAVELQGAVEVIHIAAGRGQMLPARLRLDQRVVKRIVDGAATTRRFAVPVLDIEVSPGQLLAGGARLAIDTAGEAAAAAPAIDATVPLLTPVSDDVASRPVGTVAEQMQRMPERKARRNAAQPIPASGLAPRTVADATTAVTSADRPPTPDPQPDDVADVFDRPITAAQMKALHASLHDVGAGDRDAGLALIGSYLDRDIASTKDLTVADASTVLSELGRLQLRMADDPTPTEDVPDADDE